MREERPFLRHVADLPALGRYIPRAGPVDDPVTDRDRAGVSPLEASQQPEQGGLAAARRPEDGGERSARHVEVQPR